MTTRSFARLFEAGGYVGICCIQGAALPSLIGNLAGWTHQLPPLSMTLLVWIGLCLFLARSIYNRQTLYIVSESVGLILQTALLAMIALPYY